MKAKTVLNSLITILAVTALVFQSCKKEDDEPDKIYDQTDKVFFEQAFPNITGEITTIELDGIEIVCEMINGLYVYQGDIIIKHDVFKSTEGSGIIGTNNRWSNKTIYYVINENLPEQDRIIDAIDHWTDKTSLEFIQRQNEDNYIEFVWDEEGCWSYLGMIGGRQEIGIADWGESGSVIHEIGHAVGLIHEHSKPNRDDYVIINWDNIEEDKSHNFDIHTNSVFIENFDFNSIMLYSSYAFSNNQKPTITKEDGSTYTTQRDNLSLDDIQIIKEMYSKPIAFFTVSPESGDITIVYTFDASGCTDPEDPTSDLLVRWDFDGDGYWDTNWHTDKIENHLYNSEGVYTSKMEVKDSEGLTDQYSKNITVINDASSTFIDPRDGQTYATVDIGSQTWMAENLNYETEDSWWYDNSSANGDIYGRLYTWEEALIACPSGWHLPSDEEWKTMEMALGMSQSEADDTGWRGTDEGGKMKETGTTHWNSPNTGATNTSGFTALPGGHRNSSGSFYYLGSYGFWWSSSEYSGTLAWRRGLSYDFDQVFRVYDHKTYGFSVRCLKD